MNPKMPPVSKTTKISKKRGRPPKSANKKNKEKTIPIVSVPKKKILRRYLYAVGRRKTAVSRVRYYKNGQGKILINGQDFKNYFREFTRQRVILSPLELIDFKEKGDFSIKVAGGGKRGQAESVRLGISRLLSILNQDWRRPLKKAGLLTRDSREKERKKYGLKRARRAPQWQKR